MWLLFIVVVLVISVLMIFLIMAIRMLAGQAKEQLNRYFLKNLETYDRLAEHKTGEIDALQGQIDELQDRLDNMKSRIQAMADTGAKQAAGSVSTVSMELTPTASYRDPGFLEDYAYVRRHMKLDYEKEVEDILRRIQKEDDPELLLCQDMLDKIPMEYLYEIITMQETDQIEYLKELFDDDEDAYLDRYVEETGAFDLLAFHDHLTSYARVHGDEVYIQTGNPEDYAALEREHVHVVYDPDVHEGVRVSYKNTLYDFSL